MKSYEEMADAVLARARAEKAVQKKRNGRLLAAAICICFAGLAVFAGVMGNQHAGEETRNPRVSVFCVSANASQQRQEMVQGEKLPYHAVIRVHDVTGLGELELLELREADKEYARQMAEQNSDEAPGNPNWSISSPASDKTMISTIFAGSYYMTVDDYSQIKDVTSTTTEIGWTAQHLSDYYDPALKDGIGITWGLSGAGFDMIEKDPDMPLSQIKDTITVTVEFIDGSKDVVTIDISVDDDGQIYGTFRGVDVIA